MAPTDDICQLIRLKDRPLHLAIPAPVLTCGDMVEQLCWLVALARELDEPRVGRLPVVLFDREAPGGRLWPVINLSLRMCVTGGGLGYLVEREVMQQWPLRL